MNKLSNLKVVRIFCLVVIALSSCYGKAHADSTQLVHTEAIIHFPSLHKSQYPAPYGGNFLQLANGLVIFFTWNDYHKFRKALSEEHFAEQLRLLSYNPKTKSKKIVPMSLSSSEGKLYFDDVLLTPESIDRLRLSNEWNNVLNHDWDRGCSICNLHDGRFLVSGGTTRPPFVGHPFHNAFIFDSKKNEVISSFHLSGTHVGHTSLYLSGGRVLLAGGCDGDLEIVDTVTEKTVYYQSDAEFKSCGVCLANQYTALLVNGFRDDRTIRSVASLDCETHKLSCIGRTTLDRAFGSMDNRSKAANVTMEYTIDGVAQSIGCDKFIVSGGGFIHPSLFADFCSDSRNNAEVFRVDMGRLPQLQNK